MPALVLLFLLVTEAFADDDNSLAIPSEVQFQFKPRVFHENGAQKDNTCFCSYGIEEGICLEGEICIKHEHAACFHAVEEVYNETSMQMETWHKFGCATMEKGSDASHLTCNSWRSTHAVPKSIACCYEGMQCNRHIVPPPFSGIYEHDYDPEGPIRDSHALWVFTGTAGLTIFLLFAGWLLFHRLKRVWCMKKDKVSEEDEESKWMLDMSGSGSTGQSVNQRTISQNLKIISVIGRGRYGEVRKALFKGSFVAVKTFYTTDEESWKNERDIYHTEMFNHENILQFVAADICSEDSITQMLLITDYHELGSLCDYLRREESLAIDEALHLIYTMVNGLEHLHSTVHGTGGRVKPPIAHRDLKSKNIIVKRQGVCCIADFGLAVRFEKTIIPAKPKIQVGTKRYMAPEVINRTLNPNNFSHFKMADMYAFALTMWEVTRRIEAKRSEGSQMESSESSGVGESLSSNNKYHPKVHMNNETSDMSSRHSWVPPFEGLVESDPSFDEMRRVVCEEKRRPPIEEEWTNGNNPILRRLAHLMRECWHETPECRHNALKVKLELNKAIHDQNEQVSDASASQISDSGIREPSFLT